MTSCEPHCACVLSTNDDVTKLCAAHQEVVDAAVAAEREACAKIADDRVKDGEVGTWQGQEGLIIAADIRARSTTS